MVDYFLDENRPETCAALGLDCRTCIERSAASVAHICHGLKPAGLQRMFVRIYTSPGCAHMAQPFQAAYDEFATPAMKPMLVAAGAASAVAA
jgi:hypothetical protein